MCIPGPGIPSPGNSSTPLSNLDVSVSTVRNIIKKFTAHGPVTNLPGRGRKRKNDERLQQRIVRMVDKEPQSTSKEIQADLQTQGTTVSARTIRRHLNEIGRYGRRPRRTPLLTQRHKKARLEFAKYSFLVKHFIVLFTENKMRPIKKRTRSIW